MGSAAVEALTALFGCPCMLGFIPGRLALLLFGALLGIAIGAMPGLGGLVGLALLLPFTFQMDPLAAISMTMGLLATLNTSDTIPAVLFSVPGTNAAQATVMDGHPMARRGEAGRALGAAYTASALGGLFGAAVLALSIPVLRPVVLSFGSPEFFMLGMLGISMVAVLSGRAPGKGLVVAFLGLTLGMIGADPQTGVYRWTFGLPYLFDGIPLVPVALGLFAIPELVDLCIRGTSIAGDPEHGQERGVLDGVRDAFRHWFLIIRSSTIGVWVGAIPGLGGSVVDWLAYGHALQSSKGAHETFGKGDVRGVIAPESASNSREGGSLVPTVAFGIPGNAAMALLLSIFLIHGITPGPQMLTTNLSVTYTLIWALAIANVFGTVTVMLLGNRIAKLARLPIRPVAIVVSAIVFLAAMSGATRHLGDLVVLVAVGVLGWFMKRLGWPRPPLILAFILSSIIERYFFISVRRYGFEWMGRPIVMLLGLLIIGTIVHGFIRQRRRKPRPVPPSAPEGT